MSAEHLENHVLCADPVGQLTGQSDAPYLRHPQIERFSGHRQRDLNTAGTECEHAERARGRCMAVGTNQRQARLAEPLHMHRMAYPVARTAVPDPETPASASQE
jgi:hypothetical protein